MLNNPSNPNLQPKAHHGLKVVAPSTDSAPPRSRVGRIVAWTAGIILALICILVIAGHFVLNSARFHTYLVRKIDQKATTALGTDVKVEGINIQLSKLSADVYGLTVLGAPPYRNPPLLQIQHVQISIGITSLLHRKWYLKNILVYKPVVKFFSNAQGTTNLPHPQSKSSGSSTNIFQLAIRHAVLSHGVIYVNDRKIPLEADVQQLQFHSRSLVGKQGYTGHLSYQQGEVQTGALQTIPHSFDASFTATPSAVDLSSATLRTRASQLHLTAKFANYSAPIADAQYDVSLDGADIRSILKDASIPTGVVTTHGSIHYVAEPVAGSAGNSSFINLLVVRGELQSPQLNVHTPRIHTSIRDLGANYLLQNGNLSVSDFHTDVLGGKVLAALQLNDLAGRTQSQFTATWKDLSLREVQTMLAASAPQQGIRLTGVANGTVKVHGGKTVASLIAQAQSSIHGKVTNKNSAQSLPLDSEIRAMYLGPSSEIQLQNSYLKMPQTSLTLSGALDKHSNIAIQFHSSDLRELQTLANVFHPGISTAELGLAGTASFIGNLRGTTKTPKLTGQLTASNVHIDSTVWPHIQSGVSIDPNSASLQSASLQLSPSGSIHLSATLGLQRGTMNSAAPLRLQLQASRLPIDQLAAIAHVQSPVTGELDASADLHGTVSNPIGNANLSLNHATAYNEPLKSATVTVNGSENDVHGDLSIQIKAGTIHGVATVQPKEKTFSAQLDAEGILLAQLKALASRAIGGAGGASFHASGHGTFDNPTVTAHLQIPKVEIQGQTISEVKMDSNLADHVGTATLHLRAADTPMDAHGAIHLTGDEQLSAVLDTQAISLQSLAAMYAPQATGVSGQTEIHARVDGPLKQKQLLVAHITLPILRVAYGQGDKKLQLAATAPIHADYAHGVLQLHPVTLTGTDTHLQMQASIPLVGAQQMSALLSGTVNLQLAQMLNTDISSSGKLILDVRASGTHSDPRFGGEIRLEDANYMDSTQPVGLQHGNGVFKLTNDRVNIQSLKAQVGSGTLAAQGAVIYRPALQFDLGAIASNVRLLYPEGLREDLSANLHMVGNQKNSQLSGSVQVNNISFTPAFDLMGFIGGFSSSITPPPTPGFSQNLHLQLAVRSTSGIDLMSRELSLNGSANLQVRGTAAQPVILGRINLNSGDLIFNGNRYVMNGGTVEFVNASETQPVVNLSLNTTIQQYNIHMRFRGPLNQIQTNYASDPSLPYADIIHLLAFGDTTEANSANGPTPGNVAAESVLASQVSSQVTSRFSKVAGISQLSINPVLAGGTSQGPAGAIVTVKQRVTGNFFVTFSTNVTTTQDQTVMGQYNISPRVAVTGTRDQNGGFALDTIFKKIW